LLIKYDPKIQLLDYLADADIGVHFLLETNSILLLQIQCYCCKKQWTANPQHVVYTLSQEPTTNPHLDDDDDDDDDDGESIKLVFVHSYS